MQENNFEKQVRERLDELKIRPSLPVWTNVAANIQKKRRRRVVAYLSIAALFCIALFFTQPWSAFQHKKLTHDGTSMNDEGEGMITEGEGTINEESLMTHDESRTTDGRTSKTEERDRMTETESNTNSNVNSQTDLSQTANRKLQTANQVAAIDNPQTNLPETANRKPQSTNQVAVIGNQQTNLPETADRKPQTANQSVANRKLHTANYSAPNLNLPTDHRQIANRKPIFIYAVPDNNPITVKRKFDWALEFSAGVSRRTDRFLPGLTSKVATADMTMAGGNVFAPAAPSASIPILPSESGNSPAFSLGITGRLAIARKINLLVGLKYTYQSDRILVGQKMDTTITFTNASAQAVQAREYYTGQYQKEFINQYHFMEAPVSVEFQLNKGRKTPIRWDLGLAPGYMIASNALVYDTAYTGIYYKDASVLNRFQLSATTGLSIQLGNRSKVKWDIGPEFRMNITSLSDSKIDNRQHLMYGGVRGRMFF